MRKERRNVTVGNDGACLTCQTLERVHPDRIDQTRVDQGWVATYTTINFHNALIE